MSYARLAEGNSSKCFVAVSSSVANAHERCIYTRTWKFALAVSALGLFAAAITQWVLIRWLGDVWWVGTIVMFAPRWLLLAPLAVVAAGCLLWRRKLLWVNAVSAALLFGPVMGLCLPLSFGHTHAAGFPIRLLTANTGDGARLDLLRAEIKRANPDVIAFQEFSTKWIGDLIDPKWDRQTARGLAVASRFPILETEVFGGGRVGRYHDNGLRIRVRTPAGDAWICCIYLDSPRNGLESLLVTRRGISGVDGMLKNIEYRGELSKLIRDWVAEVKGPTIVAGDMNQPAESYFFRRDWSSRRDAYSAVRFGYGHTWFSRWHGLRIDHVMVDDNWTVTSCHVAGFTGGDHHPLVADLMLDSK